MLHNLRFASPMPGPMRQYVLSWDDETGELSGENADDIKYWAKVSIENGTILCDDLNGEIPAIDPLKNKTEFCALMGLDALPDSLKPFYPTPHYPGFVGFDDVEDPGVITPKAEVLY
ncbi:hypothetical protein [Methylobacter sp.]|uniref:hypothetical protein n=1 Tax=Methylobacter sp. TaxID=2051955 RepID=UPI002489947B|nr:hypothetical protein [Methylobacter sp.]MDI1278027.1 hypothetical protein [Methylobacter sp.]